MDSILNTGGFLKYLGSGFFMAHELLLKEIGHLIRPNSRPHFSVGLLPASGGLLSNDKKIEIEKSKQTHQTWARRLKKIWWKWGLPHSPTRQQANGLVESVRRCTYTASRSFNNKSRPVNSWLNPNYWGLIEHSGSVMGLKWIFHFLHLQHINYANISRLGSNLYLGLYAAFDSVFYCP